MTAPNPMTRQELLELAALDALGLLDEYEAALYTRSFHQVPPAVQDEIMQLQALITADPALLHHEEPDEGLRDRVLDYVSRAMEKELAPIATIGRRQQVAADRREVVGRIGFAGSMLAWRVATFALCGMVLVLAYFYALSVQRHHEVTGWVLDSNTSGQIEQLLGRTFKDFFFDDTTHRISFTSADGETGARAVLLIAEDFSTAILVIEGLPEGDYQLTVRDGNGSTVVETFPGRQRLQGVGVDAVARFASLGPDARWEITGPDGIRLVSVA